MLATYFICPNDVGSFIIYYRCPATFRGIGFWRKNTQLTTQIQVARYIALPFIWNATIAYLLLVALPIAFGAKISVILLFQRDVGWVAVISGVFAIVWGLLRTSIVISTMRHKS